MNCALCQENTTTKFTAREYRNYLYFRPAFSCYLCALCFLGATHHDYSARCAICGEKHQQVVLQGHDEACHVYFKATNQTQS